MTSASTAAHDNVSHEEHDNRGRFFIERDGKRIAEMTYRRTNPKLVIIDHTEVDASLRGQSVSRGLLDAAAAWARTNDTKLAATCPYAVAQFAKDASLRDVVAS